jgi:molybdenum cofactor biosynthesis protein MoaC
MTDLDLPAPLAGPPIEERPRLLDVPSRPATTRTAVASGVVVLGPEAFAQLRDGRLADALPVARVAGVLGAKQTSRLLPFCHDVLLQDVDLDFELDEAAHAVEVRAIAKAEGPTGVEMEALTAVTVAALALYDACSPISKEIVVTDVRLLAKTGGQSGDYRRPG